MKTKILLAAFVTNVFLSAPPAHADNEAVLIGKWEANTTMNGYMERGVLILRANGTGRNERFAVGQPSMRAEFRWKLKDGRVTFTYAQHETRYGLLRLAATNTFVLTPANSSFFTIGPDLEYARQFKRNSPYPATKRAQVIGVWEAVQTNEVGWSCRIELVLRDYGTGQHAFACGNKRRDIPTTWEFSNGVVTETSSDGSTSRARIRFLDETNMGTTPIGNDGTQTGEETFYQKTAENDEGC
jgi:hypothetical protein